MPSIAAGHRRPGQLDSRVAAQEQHRGDEQRARRGPAAHPFATLANRACLQTVPRPVNTAREVRDFDFYFPWGRAE
jgi:hypothetical protein